MHKGGLAREDEDFVRWYDLIMIGIALLLSLVAIILTIVRRRGHWKLVLVLAGLSIATFSLVGLYANSCSGDFCGIGQAVIGSVVGLVLAVAAVIVAYLPNRSST